MVAYSFKARFVVPITSGAKRQTIRRERRGQAKPGSALQLYYAQRTVYCRLLGLACCSSVEPVEIRPGPFGEGYVQYPDKGLLTEPFQLDRFAQRDGFDDWAGMVSFWAVEHPKVEVFRGDLIEWTDFQGASS